MVKQTSNDSGVAGHSMGIFLPEITGGERQWVCCHGRVVRVEADSASGQRGVAVKVERLEFLPEAIA